MRLTPLLIGAALLFPLTVLAHDDDEKPKTPSKAVGDLKKARRALDSYKMSLMKSGKYGCCMTKPINSEVAGCDVCAKSVGGCHCGANLAAGKGVCGECFGAWKNGKGDPAFAKFVSKTLSVLPSDSQSDEPVPANRGKDWDTYLQAMTAAKKTLFAEKRYNCCIGRGGCDECAHETYCPCAKNLAKDMAAPAAAPKKGVCGECVDGQHGGHGRLGKVDLAQVQVASMDAMEHGMRGALGAYPMNREGSGTSWMPDSSPMYMKMSETGRYHLMQMGQAFGVYTDTGGLRGERRVYGATNYMLMARRETGGSTFGLRTMLSLDPLTIGGRGYPDLLQTGETYAGKPLVDRQHPHDLFMELAATYARPLKQNVSGFLYLAPVGEPPLGPTAFPHRPSAWDNPAAPISHHWLDGSHITFGVATAGLTFGSRWKLEGSVFTGREPNEYRYDFDQMRFDSYAGRLTYNPSRDWSLQASYGFLKQPEATEPNVDQHRLTVSAMYNRAFANRDNWANLIAYGRNIKPGNNTDALLLESAYTHGKYVGFTRYDNVVKDELQNVPAGNHRIQKFTLGGVYNFQQSKASEQGFGISLDVSSVPSALKPVYGSSPVGFSLFYRARFGRM